MNILTSEVAICSIVAEIFHLKDDLRVPNMRVKALMGLREIFAFSKERKIKNSVAQNDAFLKIFCFVLNYFSSSGFHKVSQRTMVVLLITHIQMKLSNLGRGVTRAAWWLCGWHCRLTARETWV